MHCRAVLPLLLLPATALTGQNAISFTQPYEPITAQQRLKWFSNAALGPSSLLTGAVSAGIDTLRNDPPEYGPHWGGFGERYGFRLVNRTVSSGIEASMGSLWGEDPRYHRVPQVRTGARVRNVLRMTVVSHNHDGHETPAYARLIAIPSISFLSNTWIPDSRNSTGDALNRIAFSFATHALSNAFIEFWPDIRRRLHRNRSIPDPPSAPPAVALR
ncbi:MAG: hypothetical protein QOJ99_5933 [Bryobacterales bacterium]|nr:hypothetical protein [Bryobacterales bacterium]